MFRIWGKVYRRHASISRSAGSGWTSLGTKHCQGNPEEWELPISNPFHKTLTRNAVNEHLKKMEALQRKDSQCWSRGNSRPWVKQNRELCSSIEGVLPPISFALSDCLWGLRGGLAAKPPWCPRWGHGAVSELSSYLNVWRKTKRAPYFGGGKICGKMLQQNFVDFHLETST